MLPLPLLFCSFHLSVGWKAGTKAGAEAANLDYKVTLARENTSDSNSLEATGSLSSLRAVKLLIQDRLSLNFSEVEK